MNFLRRGDSRERRNKVTSKIHRLMVIIVVNLELSDALLSFMEVRKGFIVLLNKKGLKRWKLWEA